MYSQASPQINHQQVRRTSSVYLSPVDSIWGFPPTDRTTEQILRSALADVLGLDVHTIARDASFSDLGGNAQAAKAVRNDCRQKGLFIRTRDILTCKTIAELETRAIPLSPNPSQPTSSHSVPPLIVSPLQLTSPVSKFNTAMSISSPQAQLSAGSKSPPGARGQPQLQPKSSKRHHNQVEQVLSLNGDVSKAVVLKPKAGLFEGQSVAFITLSSCVIEGPSKCEIKPLSAYYTSRLPTIRKAVEAKVAPTIVPKVWIVLERIPLDDAGKIDRRKLQTWIQNANEAMCQQIMSIDSQEILATPMTDVEERLQKVVGKVLNVQPQTIAMNLPFAELGGNSTAAMQVVVRCKSQGISLKAEDVLQAMSLTQLASLAISSEVLARNSIDSTTEEFELTPMQRFYFHTPMGSRISQRASRDGSCRFNQSMLLRFKKSIGMEDIRAAIETVVGHHAMLRARFRPSRGSWSQYTLSEVSSSYHFGHHSVRTDASVEAVIKQAQASIDIENGPVFAAHHFHTNDGHQLLYLVAHHLVVDFKSWSVIVDDLDQLLLEGSLASGRAVSFREWTAHQRRRVNNTNSPIQFPFQINGADCGYWGVNQQTNNYANTVTAGFTLGTDITSLLSRSNETLRTDSSDIFLAALLLSFSQTFRDRPTPAIWNQEHERTVWDAEVDISETVGWFTSLCPLAVDISPSDDLFKVLRNVKDARRTVADRGVSYFASNLMDAESADSFTSSQSPLEIIFTYVGPTQSHDRQESLLEQIPVPNSRSLASPTSDIGPNVGRIALFEVSAAIDHGEAKFRFVYHRLSRHHDLIDAWIHTYEVFLQDGIKHLRSQHPELSMSDIPLMDMTYDGLSKLNREILPTLGIDATNIETVYPATANQQHILINESLIPGSSGVQTIYALSSLGNYIDIKQLCAAWQQVTTKHPVLRTLFVESSSKNGLFDQLILRHHSPNMLFIESRTRDNALYDLEKLPPLTSTKRSPAHRLVVCQAPGKTFLKLEMSQALCDGSSLAILFTELNQAYFNRTTLGTSGISYLEYLKCLKTTPCSIEFWRERLAGVQPCHFPNLLSQEQQVDGREFETTSVELGLSCRSVDQFSQQYQVDVTAVLSVAWGLVLRFYVGSDSVCFGYRTSGRDLPVEGLSDAVGCFSTVLIGHLAVHSSQSIAQMLMDAEENHREALHHQHVPVSSIEHVLKRKGDRLFNSCLSFGYENIDETSPASMKFRHVKLMQASEYDFNVDVNFRRGNLALDIGHRIVTPVQAENVAHAFERAVRTVLDNPGGTVREVDLFNDHDHRQIVAWNSEPKMDTTNENVHRLIGLRACDYPGIQAVCAWDGDFTYGELDELSIKMASYLVAWGVQPGTPVPVIVDKSRWAVVAMLAVLNIGAILIPVDVALTSMFSWIIKNVGAQTVLASESVREHLPGRDNQVIYLDEETLSSITALPTVILDPHPTSSYDAACILFNTASAMNHKGIAYSHGALATACIGQASALRINPSSRVMQLSSYSVDIALTEIFTTLVNGGCVCVPSAVERVEGFTPAAQRMNVNWTYLTPTLSRKLQPENLPNLSIVCFRTRQLEADTYGPWVGKAKILLAYGSAEACPLGLSASEVTASAAVRCIGKPFCGNYWIVNPDDCNRLMPVGAVGELVIGGPTLANGYDLTGGENKTYFTRRTSRANLGDVKPGRLLKTGHFVRYTEDGQIELVSSRGENTEITAKVEPRLRRCLGRGVDVVVDTIAFKYQDSDSTSILVAFVELGDSLYPGEPDLNHLSAVTKERLFLAKKMAEMALRDVVPNHLIPSTFIPVKQMPLTPSLKVDRRALQKMIMGLSKSQLLGLSSVPNPHEVQAASLNPLPLTKLEQRVRAIWARVLDVQESSITSNDGFVGLGGDSDLAHDLVITCRQQDLDVSIIDVLRNFSLTELCKVISVADVPVPEVESNMRKQRSPSNVFVGNAVLPQVGLEREEIEDFAEASSLQTAFIESGMLRTKGDISYLVINMTGPFGWDKLENAAFQLTKAHPMLRTAFITHNQQLFQTVLRSYKPEFQRYQCPSWRLSNLATKIIKRDQSAPINFRQPVTKFFYLDAGKSSILVMRLSRAQYNEASLPAIMNDLSRCCDHGDMVTQRPGFCDVVRAAQHASHNGAIDYWRTLLEEARMTQVVSQPTPLVASSDSKTIHRQIPTGSIQHLGIPFETILKGAWSVVLSNLSGSDDVVFGQLVEGKHLSLPGGHAVADVVGPTGNIIPVRTRLPDVPITPYEYFRCVQSQHVASVPHENMEFSDIISKCTSWPSWTNFSTVVQHQNSAERINLGHFLLGGATCKLNYIESNHQNSDMFVRSVTAGAAHVDISLTFSEKRMHPIFADEVLKMLCSTITLLTSAFIMEPLMLKGLNDDRAISRIPLPSYNQDKKLETPVQSVTPDHASAIHAVISSGWDAILSTSSLHVSDVRSVPFYDIWGSLIPAAELARFYNENMSRLDVPGLEQATFTLEDILEHPTMMKQFEMIIAQQQGVSSVESMTSGSSQSDVDELRDEVKAEISPLTPVTPFTRKKPSVGLDASAHALKKKGSGLLGRMGMHSIGA
ncbi:non-ribosomal peptide synthetase [Pseudomassariella vexata]|uniref:Non-ribosomal peptide synthetase n=1 Tax=Pseudomassariella vexata TaxID=1141098 RepID=A0A1Y2DHD6_9PEZI|nr:non-ribosomal peptide synthetase [Pseudomassariella vexata]ORY58546.1 non-ribosomal peptide synthetase [Pseudomassariella vexata]